MAQATYDDVNLILRLYELRREDKMRAARGWFFGNFRCKNMEEFGKLCPPGTDANAHFRQFTSYWEMCASFVTAGVLNPDLFFANTREMLVCWERVKPIIGEVRAAFKDPSYLGNLEKCGIEFGNWISKTSGEEAYTGFVKRTA
jgi:hypothetical protein